MCIESTINLVLRLCGGKKKRKKKIYTKPKKIGHKHKKRPKALLEYFNVDNTGKISKLKIECEKCPAGKLEAFKLRSKFIIIHTQY
jgi:ubiquitin-small subunit ribosomal protein S27Ae